MVKLGSNALRLCSRHSARWVDMEVELAELLRIALSFRAARLAPYELTGILLGIGMGVCNSCHSKNVI